MPCCDKNAETGTAEPAEQSSPKVSRRALLAGTGVAVAGLIGYPLVRRLLHPPQPVFRCSQFEAAPS